MIQRRSNRTPRWLALSAVLSLVACAHGPTAASDGTPPGEPAVGRLLVAAVGLPDPRFAHTVVLLLHHGETGSLGVILNRSRSQSLAEAMPSVPELAGRKDRLHYGGPVQPDRITVLVRLDEPPAMGRRVFDHVWLVERPDVLPSLIQRGLREDRLRAYGGYAGWGPNQLATEIARGDWEVRTATPADVFGGDDRLWHLRMERSLLPQA